MTGLQPGRRAVAAASWLALVLVGAIGASSAGAAGASLVITYVTPTSFRVTLGDGTVVQSGTVIPAGSYGVTVTDDPNTGDLDPELTISGPGVGVDSDLNSTGMGIDGISVFGPYTLQTSSSYAIEDKNIGPSSAVTFSTTSTATAVAAAVVGSSSSGSGVSSPATGFSAPGSTSSPSTGGGSRLLGTIRAAVGPAGAAMMFGGKPVAKLRAGRYRVAVGDRSRQAGLILERPPKRAITLSGSAATGTSFHTVTLSAGKWFFAVSAKGRKTFFTVT